MYIIDSMSSTITSNESAAGAPPASFYSAEGYCANDSVGLHGMPVNEVGGHLTDHYDPIKKALFLSSENYHGTSIAAVGVAAHEAGHALDTAFRLHFKRLHRELFGSFAQRASRHESPLSSMRRRKPFSCCHSAFEKPARCAFITSASATGTLSV